MNPGGSFVTDTGTGNTLIDAFIGLFYPGKSYDKMWKSKLAL
jgi:anhydro-N-acetylmuramic acid kinase